jgi:hypothetical protein
LAPLSANLSNRSSGESTLKAFGADEAKNHIGLWVGLASINAVSEPHAGLLTTNLMTYINGVPIPLSDSSVHVITNLVVTTNLFDQILTNQVLVASKLSDGTPLPIYSKIVRQGTGKPPTPTKSEFPLRLIIHVDTNGKARLLKEVVQLWKNGTYTNDAAGNRVVDQPGQNVLITDETLFSLYQGITVRDNKPVGRRISSAGFDFPAEGTNNFLTMTGNFALNSILYANIALPPDFPSNPFRHKYHPDHDNLDATFQQYKAEAYAITRSIELEFSSTNIAGVSSTDYGYNTLSGIYRETISGLHKTNLMTQGTFQLK